jgi:enamine deaminase RidA (YjgF/YER057c/UK114 family)
MRALIPTAISAPLARYAHGIKLPAGSRIMRTSGQLGIATGGAVPESAAGQAAICFDNILHILAEGAIGVQDICHISAWLTERGDLFGCWPRRMRFFATATCFPHRLCFWSQDSRVPSSRWRSRSWRQGSRKARRRGSLIRTAGQDPLVDTGVNPDQRSL